MPKKPFTPAEIESQQNRIMDGAARVMAETGYHQLSMRTLAARLEMTASNIYNYFPGKESLFLNIRRRGFELAFRQVFTFAVGQADTRVLVQFVRQLVGFDQAYPGYYLLMFQSPALLPDESAEDLGVLDQQVQRLVTDWQQQVQQMLTLVCPSLNECGVVYQQRVTLYFLASVHGLISSYRYQSFPDVSASELSDDVISDFVSRVISGLGQIGSAPVSASYRQNA